MGNRAVISTKAEDVGVYLHWNGGRDSVVAFLTYCELRGFRYPEDDDYGWARLCQIISNFFGKNGTSVGINLVDRLDSDNGDNGQYIIEKWQIVGRKHFDPITDGEQTNYELDKLLLEIDEAQPADQQLGAEKIAEGLAKLREERGGAIDEYIA